MGKNDVNFKITGDSGDAQRAWLEVIGVMKQMQTELSRMGNKLDMQSRKMTDSMDKSADSLRRLQRGFQQFRMVLGVIGSVKQAFALLNQEISAFKEAGARQLDPRLRYEYSLRGLAQNMTAQDFHKVRKAIEQYQGPLGRDVIAENVKYAVSSVGLGFAKEEVARGAVEIAERFPELAANQEASNLITTGMLRLYSAAPTLQQTDAEGRPDYGMATAFFKGALQKSAQASPEDFAKYTAVAASQLISSYGMSPEQAMAMLASTQTETGDITGRMGARVAINMAENLRTIGTKYGVGDGNVFEVREWLRKGETKEAQQALKDLVGLFSNTEKLVGDLRGLKDSEIEGALSTAAKYRVPLKQWVTGTGKVGQTSAETLAALDVARMTRVEAERQQMFQESPVFEFSRRDILRRSLQGERQERKNFLTTLGSYEETLAAIQEAEQKPEGGFQRWVENWSPMGWYGMTKNPEEQLDMLMMRAASGIRAQFARGGLGGQVPALESGGWGNLDHNAILKAAEQLSEERRGRVEDLVDILRAIEHEFELKVRIVDDERPAAAAPVPATALGE